jgi:hypothetical protein
VLCSSESCKRLITGCYQIYPEKKNTNKNSLHDVLTGYVGKKEGVTVNKKQGVCVQLFLWYNKIYSDEHTNHLFMDLQKK